MEQHIFPYVYCHHRICPEKEAQVSIASHSLQYGTTCFGGIRGYYQKNKTVVFRLHDHYERLMNASKILGMNFFISYEEFHHILAELIQKNRPTSDFYIRPFIFSPDRRLTPKLLDLHFELAIFLVEMRPLYAADKGIRLGISSWQKFSDQALPTKAKAGGCYVNSALATADAIRNGYEEALLMDREGNIVEASVANILMVYRDRVLSPFLGSPMLEGITLRTMIDLLADSGITVESERIDRSMAYSCQEMILLGTAAQITFVESIDGRRLGKVTDGRDEPVLPGPICQLLRNQFEQVLTARHPRSAEWCVTFPMEPTS